jgi:4-amino-4-deoxy-L-arabinose transferase-like glycosyltransferase
MNSPPDRPDPAPVPDLRPLLWALMAWHLLFWTLAPAFGYRMLPLDTLELLGWGQEWQWGYYKHPPLGAWLGEAALWLGGGRLEALYLLAQACIVLTLWYVWKCARLFLDPARAVLATVLLEGSYYHTYLSPNFNMNLLQLPAWAGFSYHLLRALQGAPRHWLACGAWAAACLLGKYSGALLLASAGVLLLGSAAGRAQLRLPWPWLGALLALLLLAPHLAWLAEHAALPLQYLRSFDAQAPRGWSMHVLEPLRFAAGALLGLSFAALLFATVAAPRAAPPSPRAPLLPLLVLALGPLLLAMLYGALSGSRLKSTWAMPFVNLAGVLAFAVIPTRIDPAALRRFGFALAAVALLAAAAHLAYKALAPRSKTRFDGAALAAAVARDWNETHASPLRIVAGDHIVTAIVSGYAPSRPSMLVGGDFSRSLWLQPDALRRDGAALVCEVSPQPCLPALAAAAESAHEVEVAGRRFRYWLLPPQAPAPAR